MGIAITVSGTVGAALEAAAQGIPAMAVSLETDIANHLTYSPEINFSVAAHFTQKFAHCLLKGALPQDVDVLKIDSPLAGDPSDPPALLHRPATTTHPGRPTRTAWI
jgi:5'-nucleotidase